MAGGNGDFGRNAETHYAITPLSIRLEALQLEHLLSPQPWPHLCSWMERFDVMKRSTLLSLIYTLNTTPITYRWVLFFP